MACPHLKEVVMLYCRAYPVKKLIPLDRIASGEPCFGCEFTACPLFKDALSGPRAHRDAAAVAPWPAAAPEEIFS